MKRKIKSESIISLLLLILIVVIPIVGFQLNKAPKAVPENAPLTEFSAVRAIKHLEHIASEPHSIGTNAHAKVRDYIIDELKKLGIEPEIQITEVFYPDSYLAATIKNIIVTFPGTESDKSVLVVGHYDSVTDSYGASDDGSALVTMLETIRLLLLKQPFKNDIIFLFTDAEEIGLIGAKAFIDEHPLAKNIGLVLNFESSGTSGPSMMFETSTDNNWIISEFAKAVPYPIANSLSYEIYRNMPNDTDLSPFKNNGFKGFNFAYIENKFDYHTGGDNIKNTSVESIQHHG
ncbi:MAG TPA: M20/M25/M40 family metallo-hydrolase, partial [Draconibacterium sp.]|nr:M20/M25/M40 family metallo-hydrolase [Draconibacterium sp.]